MQEVWVHLISVQAQIAHALSEICPASWKSSKGEFLTGIMGSPSCS